MSYSNFSQVVKNEIFLWNFFDIFSYFCSKHRMWVHGSKEYPQSMFWSKNKNKRTNGPVNAHLRSAVYTNDIENSPSIGADEALGPFFFSE